MPVLLILLVPVLVRLPGLLLGLRDSPVWAAANLALPGASQLLPGLPGFLDLNAGWTTQALGGAAAQQWLAFQVPWWDPYSGIGMPLAAGMQSAALFLPYILLLALPGGFVLLTLALQWTAGFATWRLLRRLGLDQGPATTGALLFQLSAAFAWLGPPAGLPAAFLPLFLLGLERARAAGWRLIAAAVALSLYAGFPETAYLDGLLALMWAAVRLVGLPRDRQAGFAARVAGGGVVGLLLAAPLLWPFLHYLPDAYLGLRERIDMSRLALPAPGLVQLLAPYALGLPAGLSGQDPAGVLPVVWGRAGGYAGMALALAALLGACATGPERALRWALLAWVALLLGRVAGVPLVAQAMQVVPFAGQMQVFRYSGPAWLLPCCILAASALQHRAGKALVVGLAALLLGVLGLLAWVAQPLVRTTPGAAPYFTAALAWAVLSAVATATAFAWGGRWWRAVVLAVDAALLFMAPLAAGQRNAVLDTPAVTFLHARLGLQRFATLGPLQPNYGAMFGLASVNHNYLPVPARWANHVATSLRPGGEAVLFTGNHPPDRPDRQGNAAILAQHLPAYAALGVRYVLAPAGPSPFGPPAPAQPPGVPEALVLPDGGTLSGVLDAAPGPVAALSVMIGTYDGQSNGTLSVTACRGAACRAGSAALQGAPDNKNLAILLDTPLGGDEALRWTLRHDGTFPAVIWRWPGPVPHMLAHYIPAPDEPVPVYRDALMDIYEVPGAAPYFSIAQPGCTLAPQGRTRIDVNCPVPATLVRRELAMPGWRAVVNGTAQALGVAEGLFQTAALPAGPVQVDFEYRPPGMAGFTALFAAGVLALLSWGRLRRR